MENIEIEVKFYLDDIQKVRSRLTDLGARCQGKVFETNLRLEDKDKSLIRNQSLLRLRRDTKTTLTFKAPVPGMGDKFKIFKELEVEISNLSTMQQIFESLGFHIEQKYEKWREIYARDHTHFCIDEMPYGCFFEIEGEKNDIKYFAATLGLDWKKRILLNYLEMFEIIKKKLQLPFSDVTFSNFENVKVDFSQFIASFEIGHA